MVTKKTCVLMIVLAGLLLVSCSNNGSVEQSVQETMAAISVEETVAALRDDEPTDAATAVAEITATQPPPTAVEAVTTATNPPPTAVIEATNPPPTAAVVPTNTSPPPTAVPTATTAGREPPDVSNDAPGGSFPDDGTVSFNIIVDPTFLFRMGVRDLTVGDFEGAGIESVEFFIFGNEVDYQRTERTPGFCVFGGGEPTCNPWPQNELGQYTWGVGGPVVEGGDYFVNMVVTAARQDENFGNVWNWNFDFAVTLP